MFSYPVVLHRDDNGTILVRFPDIPDAITFGNDEADALAHAADALETAILALMQDGESIPEPSVVRKRHHQVALPALSAAKVALYQAMRQAGVGKAELRRRLGWTGPQTDRLLDLRHGSGLDQIEQALRAVGKKLVVSVRDAA